MHITSWLDKFHNAWINHDIDAVIALFADEVEYWETPFKKLDSIAALRGEWLGIRDQKDIKLETRLFNQQDGKYSVIWHLTYRNQDGIERELAGTYLIELDSSGLCTYFYHTGEFVG